MAAIRRTSTFTCSRAAEPLELALLQNAQKFYLRGGGDVSDFVEEQRALVGQLEFAGLTGGGAGEGAFFVAEEFALEQGFGNRGAVDLDERAGRRGWSAGGSRGR